MMTNLPSIFARVITIIIIFTTNIYADQFSKDSIYDVCFTPQNNCTSKIVTAINHAKQEVLVQAYSFTSKPIAKALINAKQRGITIKMICDAKQYEDDYWLFSSLARQNIPIFIDANLPGVAHNKVLIIDTTTVITGSFNFTKAAEQNNAENVLIITDTNLASKYKANWLRRYQQAKYLDHTKI